MKHAATIIVTLLIMAAVAACCRFGSISVCSICGRHQQAVEYQFPVVPLTYWKLQSISDTPLSACASACGVPPSHTHDWQFVHGSGNGVTCAIGDDRGVAQNSRQPIVAAFIVDTERYRNRQEATTWFKTALDKTTARPLLEWLITTGFSESGNASAETYEAWRHRADSEWPTILDQHKRR